MHTKRALLQQLHNLSPEARGALIGSLVGAGSMGLGGALFNRKNRIPLGLLGLLQGGLIGGAGGYFAGGGNLDKLRYKFSPIKATPGGLSNEDVKGSIAPGAETGPGITGSTQFTGQPFKNK